MLKVPVSAHDHIRGNAEAKLILVEYGDYQCPFCAQAHPIILKLLESFGNKLKFVFRNFPLTQIHPMADAAAQTAEFAGAHQQFWPMHDLIYDNQANLSPALLFELAKQLKLSDSDLEVALKNSLYQSKVKDDFMSGIQSGVNGTPTFFINGQHYKGEYSFEGLSEALEDQ